MINFYEGQIADLLPHNLTDDPAVQAASLALRDATRLLNDYTKRVYTYCSIDTAPENVLDLLALELRTQYYSQDLELEVKRGLVRNTLIWHMTAGTPAAVEELVAVVFGEGEVEEWFEYGGNPYEFRIKTNVTIEGDAIEYFAQMVKKVKNTRSHLSAIEIDRTIYATIYAGAATSYCTLNPDIIDGCYDIVREIKQDLYAATATSCEYIGFNIVDGFKTKNEAAQDIYTGTAEGGIYTAPLIK